MAESTHNTKSMIHQFLFNKNKLTVDWPYNEQWAFFIHSSVLTGFRKFMKKRFRVNFVRCTWPYEMLVDGIVFDMRVIFLTNSKDKALGHLPQLMEAFIRISQFIFFWKDRTVLFRNLDNVHEIEEFVKIHNLEKHIVSIKTQNGFNSHNQRIKVVAFSKHFNQVKLCQKFEQFLQTKSINPNSVIYHYYLTFPFPWVQPWRLRHFDKPIKNKRMFLELQTYLTCLREMSYKTEPHLDMIGLCALKFAICDFRKESEASADLSYEIDELIKRSLKRMAKNKIYFQHDQFDLHRYAVDRLGDPFLYQLEFDYFQYYFQDFFKSIKMPQSINVIEITPVIRSSTNEPPFDIGAYSRLKVIIKLVDEHDVIKKIQATSKNIRFEVDGTQFAGMGYKLLSSLIATRKVTYFTLDTSYPWVQSIEPKFVIDVQQSQIVFDLIGNNEFKFIEEFVDSLRWLRNGFNIKLLIMPKLENYLIFKNLQIGEIVFGKITIRTSLLEELVACNFPAQLRIEFLECKIEENIRTWGLLNEWNHLTASLIEEEKMWQWMFDFIANRLTHSELEEFKFKQNVTILISNRTDVILGSIKFTMDEFKLRLDLRDVQTNQLVDLYRLKNPSIQLEEENDTSCYDFYQ